MPLVGSFIISTTVSSISVAEEKPLWELGAGLASLYNPHYLGANQEKAYLFPVPYFVYRGDVIRADRDGIRGSIYDSDKLDLRLSVGASLPVNSKDNDARKGMDDLDLMLEVGPTLQYQLFLNDKHLLRADWPLRAAFTVGDEFFRHQGWVTNPRLHHEMAVNQWTITTTLGPMFSDRRYHGYIYDVNQQDVTADRLFYQSRSGYTATRFSTGVKRRFGDYFVSANMSYYTLEGAKNEDSPLVKRDEYFAVSIVFAWILGESKRHVTID